MTAPFRTLVVCCRCGTVHGRVRQRMCADCHKQNMRQWRAKQRAKLLRLRELDRQLSKSNRAYYSKRAADPEWKAQRAAKARAYRAARKAELASLRALLSNCEGHLSCVNHSAIPEIQRAETGDTSVPVGTKLSLQQNSPLFVESYGHSTLPQTSQPSQEKTSVPASDGLQASLKRPLASMPPSSPKCSSATDPALA